MPESDPSAERERLATAVKEAGGIALKFFGGQFQKWTKGTGDSPVTEADIAANDLLHRRLVAPGDGWLSEESENDPSRLQARRVWVVDPIDGTRAFIAGREDWSISAALVIAGRPVLAALYAPVTDEMFMATTGEGAVRNGDPILASMGNGLDGARVAHGTLDAAVAGGSGHDWDLAAADLLVHEAGGMITALDGKALVYNRPDPVHGMLIAAGRERHGALVDLIRAQTSEPA